MSDQETEPSLAENGEKPTIDEKIAVLARWCKRLENEIDDLHEKNKSLNARINRAMQATKKMEQEEEEPARPPRVEDELDARIRNYINNPFG